MKRHLLTGLLLALTIPSFAQMTGWSHVEPLTVTENSGTEVLNYQLRVVVDTQTPVTNGEMLASGDDIRFVSTCGDGIQFPYWIESGMNTAATVIWVKIDTLHAGEVRTIYMNHGNPAAASVSSIPGVFVGPHSSTDSLSFANAGGVTDSQRGFRFSANEDLLVTAFGKFEPNGTTRYITLFQVSDQSILRQMQVSGPAAQYSYGNLASPVWLMQGAQYLLEMHQGSSDGYYFGAGPQVGQHLTYLDMRYCNGCDQNTYPNNTLSGIQYGYPDCWYWTKTNVTPAPTYAWEGYTVTMAGAADICSEDSLTLPLAVSGGQEPFTYAWTGGATTDPTAATPGVSPADTTTYYVALTDACGITRTDSITVNVKPLPDATISSSAPLICNGEYADLGVSPNTDTYLWPHDGSTTPVVTVMPSVTTTYDVNVTNAYGCTRTFSYEQQVNEPVLATQDVTICANQFYTIGTHTYNQDGTYTDTITGVTNCDSIVTTNLTVMPLPEFTDNVEICFGTTYTVGNSTYAASGTYVDTVLANVCDAIITTNLTVAPDIDAQAQAFGLTLAADLGGDAYQWVDCANGNTPIPGATSSFYEATANGSYGVLVTVGNCTKLSNCVPITIVGLEENDLVENISVFPNPNSGTFSVQSSKDQTVRVVNALGQTIATADLIAGQSSQIDLKGADAGMYFVVSRTKVVRVAVE